MMIIYELFNQFHDWCKKDSAYKDGCFFIKCEVHKCCCGALVHRLIRWLQFILCTLQIVFMIMTVIVIN